MKEREFRRFNSIHLVYFSLFDEDQKHCGEGVARTLNISEGGALIEITGMPDDKISTVKLEMALGDTLLILQGRVAFINKTTADTTEMGIQFFGLTSELKKRLSDFLKIFVSEREKNKNLIREKTSNIDNVVLALSKEHKIINDYVIECRKMLEKQAHEHDTKNLEIIFEFMEKDLRTHFLFEEEVLFEAALSGEQDQAMSDLVRVLKNDHSIIHGHIEKLIIEIKILIEQNKHIDQSAIEKINSLMQLIKEHSRNEMVNLFPAIDSDRSKIRILNKLLTGIR